MTDFEVPHAGHPDGAPAEDIEALRRDAARFRWLSDRFLGADFDWGGDADASGKCVLLIEVDGSVRVFGDLGATVDAAMGSAS